MLQSPRQLHQTVVSKYSCILFSQSLLKQVLPVRHIRSPAYFPRKWTQSYSGLLPSSRVFSTFSPHASAEEGTEKQEISNDFEVPFDGICAKLFVSKPTFRSTYDGIPILRQLGCDGKLVGVVELPFSTSKAVELLEMMIRMGVYDQVLYDIQRQGRISFYLTNSGEEAAHIGTGAALELEDVLFPQYRELGVLMWRGLSLDMILNQCLGTDRDVGKGRQMPVHYCSRDLNIQAISSPVGTQITHAVGAGYAFRLAGKKCCAVTYFGEGAASEGDFAVSLNFAATLRSQTLFICRNNGFAISTPAREQYKGDGIAVRAIAYGIDCIRVDGNDIVAVYTATKTAREMSVEKGKPVVLEIMSYRLGHHSTSDDSSSYRDSEYGSYAQRAGVDPVSRFLCYLTHEGFYSKEKHHAFVIETRKEILSRLKEVEKRKCVSIGEGLFGDVYDEMPKHIVEQKNSLKNFYSKYRNKYKTSRFNSEPDFPTE